MPDETEGGGAGGGVWTSILDSLAALGVPLDNAAEHINSPETLDMALKIAVSVKGGAPDLSEEGSPEGGELAEGGPPPVMMSHGERAALGKLAAADGKDLRQRIDRLFKSGRIDGPTLRKTAGALQAASLSHDSYDPKTHALKPLAVVHQIEAYEALPPGRFSKANKAGDLSHAETRPGMPPRELSSATADEDAVVAEQERIAATYSATKK